MTTPQALRCAEHPDVETYLRCAECEKPICPRCLVQTPVGAKCKEHARLRKPAMYELKPAHYLRGAGAAVGAGLGLGVAWWLVRVTLGGFFFGFLVLIAYLGIGYLTGEAVSTAANRKRGPVLQLFAISGTLLALALSGLLIAGVRGAVASLLPGNIFTFAYLIVACVIAASRVR